FLMQKATLLLAFLLPTVLLAQRTVHRLDAPHGQKVGFYQFLPPDYEENSAKKSPLIIFLHGIGEKGTGLEPDLSKLNCCGLPRYINAGNNMTFSWNGKTQGFVVLYPQLASKYGTWQNYYVDALLKYAKEKLNIDSNRIFLTGLSLGGGASWVYSSASVSNAKQFAGIVPVVSPCFMSNGCNIANAKLPVLTIHALDDTLANPKCTLNAVQQINDCGAVAHPNLIMYDNGGHYVWTKRAYDTTYEFFNPNIYEWMMAQNRLLKPNVKPIADAGKDITISSSVGTVILDGSGSYDPDGKILRYIWQKTSGPSYEIVKDEVTAHPRITHLSYPGVYTFSLRVVDDRAEWTTAKVRVTVVDGGVINQ
ncbi:MAG: PKD domain-containing protein, partial [Flavitalea sp.]